MTPTGCPVKADSQTNCDPVYCRCMQPVEISVSRSSVIRIQGGETKRIPCDSNFEAIELAAKLHQEVEAERAAREAQIVEAIAAGTNIVLPHPADMTDPIIEAIFRYRPELAIKLGLIQPADELPEPEPVDEPDPEPEATAATVEVLPPAAGMLDVSEVLTVDTNWIGDTNRFVVTFTSVEDMTVWKTIGDEDPVEVNLKAGRESRRPYKSDAGALFTLRLNTPDGPLVHQEIIGSIPVLAASK